MRRRSPIVAASVVSSLLVLAAAAACGDLKSAEDPNPSGGPGDEASTAGDGALDPDGSLDPDGGKPGDGGADGNVDAGAVCTEATCPPETLQQGLYGPVAVAVNASHVYWIEVGTTIPQSNMFGQLIRLPKVTTCKARSCYEIIDDTVLSGELEGQYIYDTHIALGLSDVCYTQSYNASPGHSIKCFALGGALPERSLDQGTGYVVDLWVGADQARWVMGSSTRTSAEGVVQGRALQAGTTTTLAPSRVGPSSVTSDGAKVYWSELGPVGPNGTINTLGSDGGGVHTLFSGRTDPGSLRLYPPYLYWLDQTAKKVMRGNADGTGTPVQIATTDEQPFDLVVDASGVYWASAGTGNSGLYGSVAHAPLTPGGQITTMLGNIDKITKIAVDTTSVYIASTGTNLDAGKIVRMRKTR